MRENRADVFLLTPHSWPTKHPHKVTQITAKNAITLYLVMLLCYADVTPTASDTSATLQFIKYPRHFDPFFIVFYSVR